MVLFTPKKLTFKRSKKQHQILAQTAYYQAGKIVVQTILPEQPPVALITLNTLGTTCSTSADTYIPIENIFNTQSCSFLESRLVSLYGGKAASLLIEYQQRLNPEGVSIPLQRVGVHFSGASAATNCNRWQSKEGFVQLRGQKLAKQKMDEELAQLRKPEGGMRQRNNEGIVLANNEVLNPLQVAGPHISFPYKSSDKFSIRKGLRLENLSKDLYGNEMCGPAVLTNCVNEAKADSRASSFNTKRKLINNVTECRTCFAGAGNNIFQSTLGNIEIQTATRLARIMVNYWNFYSFNKSSLYSIFKKDAPAHQFKAYINSINKLTNFSIGKNPRALARVAPAALARVAPAAVARSNSRAVTRVNSSAVVKVNSRAFANVNSFANTRVTHYLPLRGLQQRSVASDKQLSYARPLQNPHISFPYKSSYKSSICTEPARGGLRLEDSPEDLSGVRLPKGSASIASKICTKSRRLPPPHFASTATICTRWQSKEKFEQLKDHKQKEHLLQQHEESVAKELEAQGYAKRKDNVRVWGIKLKVKDKTLAKRWGNIIYKVVYPSGVPEGVKLRSSFRGTASLRRNNLYFAIAQSKNSLKICASSGTSNSSYNIQRLSIENIGNYSQLNNNNFQLINSLQFSNLQRDRFYANWFRLYLPDMEATEFLKNVANYYFSLGLQTFTFPSTKFNYYSNVSLPYPSGVPKGISADFEKLGVNIASPFLTFLNKNTQKEKFIPTIISYTYCPPSILVNFTSDKSIHSLFAMNDLVLNPLQVAQLSYASPNQSSIEPARGGLRLGDLSEDLSGVSISHSAAHTLNTPSNAYLWYPKGQLVKRHRNKRGVGEIVLTNCVNEMQQQKEAGNFTLQAPGIMGVDYIKDPSFTKVEGMSSTHIPGDKGYNYPLNVPFSLLLENQIFPLNYNGFSIVEKELLYNALVNSSFAKAFYLINQNRQLLDFLVDYLLRFQILRQHQILYLFSTLLLGCNKTA